MLSILTQIGGIAFVLGILLSKVFSFNLNKVVLSLISYILLTLLVVPVLAPLFGRERVKNSDVLQPTNYLTVLLNRNYVKPELNVVLTSIAGSLKKGVELRYLDANFPFIDGFPLLPHLSHNDGKKIDLSFVYVNEDGELTNLKPSRSGYGVFEVPLEGEFNQTTFCKDQGYWQYDFPKYLTLGTINEEISFSDFGTKQLMNSILKEQLIGKVFIEKHLKVRLGLQDERLRFQGCRAVRHDDHIHIQLR